MQGVTNRGYRLAALVVAVSFSSALSVLHAQTTATIGAGASIVEYDGFLASAAATLTPTVQFNTNQFSVGGQSSWTVFESGNQIFQATAAAGWLAGLRDHWHVEIAGAGGVSKYAAERTFGHALARARLHWFGHDRGAWFGATGGASFDSSTATPFEVALGLWMARERITTVATITATWLDNDYRSDITATARWTHERWDLEARVGAYSWASYEQRTDEASSGIWGELLMLVPLTRQISFALSGGSYPSDHVRRLLGAQYITAGFRFALIGPERPPLLQLPASAAVALARADTSNSTQPQLAIVRVGTLHTLRVQVVAARSVELMGDFTDWQPVPMSLLRDATWELQTQRLAAGVYRLNIRIDGGAWIVPAGARSEPDEFGGTVGIVVVDQ